MIRLLAASVCRECALKLFEPLIPRDQGRLTASHLKDGFATNIAGPDAPAVGCFKNFTRLASAPGTLSVNTHRVSPGLFTLNNATRVSRKRAFTTVRVRA